MTRSRTLFMAVLAVGLSVISCLLVLEVVLRFLPVPTGMTPCR